MLERLRRILGGEPSHPAAPRADVAARGAETTLAPAPAGPVAPTTPPACTPATVEEIGRALVPRGRPLVVNHWATWCPPCVAELPLLVRAAHRLEGHADVVGVSWDRFERADDPVDELAREVAQFAGRAGVPYATLLATDPPETLFAGLDLDFRFIPQTFLLAADGTVLRHVRGELTAADVEELVRLATPAA